MNKLGTKEENYNTEGEAKKRCEFDSLHVTNKIKILKCCGKFNAIVASGAPLIGRSMLTIWCMKMLKQEDC